MAIAIALASACLDDDLHPVVLNSESSSDGGASGDSTTAALDCSEYRLDACWTCSADRCCEPFLRCINDPEGSGCDLFTLCVRDGDVQSCLQMYPDLDFSHPVFVDIITCVADKGCGDLCFPT